MHTTIIHTNLSRPASARGKLPTSIPKHAKSPCKRGILIVEDDAPARKLLRTVLLANDYMVFEAGNENEAFRIWDKSFCQIDLLLTDICIPYQTTGVELAKKLREQKPWLKVIYTTGFSRDIVENEEISLVEGSNFFRKPYPPHQLLETLQTSFEKFNNPFLN